MLEREVVVVNERAGKLANCVTELLTTDGIRNAVVWVTDGYAFDMPLSVRTPDNDGFGYDHYPYYAYFKDLTRLAVQQARYAKTVTGRSAGKQEEKVAKLNRTATSYSFRFAHDLIAGYAIDGTSQLTVSAVAKGLSSLEMANYAEIAVNMVEKGHLPRMLEAGKWMHACFALLQPRLAELSPEASGIAMIALPHFYTQLTNEADPGPVIVAAQAVGRGTDPAKFDIVGAKVKSVTITGCPSGTLDNERIRQNHSNILGAVPALVGGYGERVLAVGGLDMHDDVELISQVAAGEVGTQLQVTILNEFAR